MKVCFEFQASQGLLYVYFWFINLYLLSKYLLTYFDQNASEVGGDSCNNQAMNDDVQNVLNFKESKALDFDDCANADVGNMGIHTEELDVKVHSILLVYLWFLICLFFIYKVILTLSLL